MTQPRIKTRFAPSPTGYLHIGGARTAIFSWCFAKHFGGEFVLRIEDTDTARSTDEATQAILEGMAWLNLQHDEGPYYQSKRTDRYKEVIAQLLNKGLAYRCYTTPEELEAMRERQRINGEKPRYDGTWRPETGKTLPNPPAGASFVIRFKNPQTGFIEWDDLVKGTIRFNNEELDDLIIARADGSPTYNFCVVVDDWDMGITHVIRGDDHINNTPRQINILNALGATLPQYGHVPMIHGEDGEKLSKRHGAVNLMEYERMGFLPDAMLNYLSRLGWSHGNDEFFTREQLLSWFDGSHLAKSPAQFDLKKLRWVNAQHIAQTPAQQLAGWVYNWLHEQGLETQKIALDQVITLFQSRAETLVDLAQACALLYRPYQTPENLAECVPDKAKPALRWFAQQLDALDWNGAEASAQIQALIKQALSEFGLKMPEFAVPLRWCVLGQAHSPALDQILKLLGKPLVLERLRARLAE